MMAPSLRDRDSLKHLVRGIAASTTLMMLAGCAGGNAVFTADVRPRSTITPTAVDVNDLGSDRYEGAKPGFAGVDQAPAVPERNASPVPSDEPEGLALDRSYSCELVSQQVMEYSALKTREDPTEAAIVQILDLRLLNDWSRQGIAPPPGGKVAVLQCWARVRWSVGWESDVDMWLLFDSERQFRVRWDNITNITIP